MGQYSEFVRPGYQRVSFSGIGGVTGSAYQGQGYFVIVAVNNSSSSVDETFDISGTTATSFTAYESYSTGTSATASTVCGTDITCLAAGSPSTVSVSGGSFTYTMPAYSVVTFVGKGTGGGGGMIANRDWPTGDLAGWTEWVESGVGSPSDVTVVRDGTAYTGDYFYLKQYDANNQYNLNVSQPIYNQPYLDNITFTVYARSTADRGYFKVANGSTNLCYQAIPNNHSTWTQYSCTTGGTGMVVPSGGQFTLVLGSSNAAAGSSVEFDSPALTVTAP
jgi:hypothetical protein